MIKVSNKNSFILYNVELETNLILKIIRKEFKNSVFFFIDYIFFKKLVKKKLINLFVIKKKNKISAVITVVSNKNFLKLKYNFLIFFLFNPHKFIFNILSNLRSLSRVSSSLLNNNSLHLLHLIIYKNFFRSVSLKKKDETINFFFKQILKKFNTKSLFLCYNTNNLKAKKFYKRNNFFIYNQTKNEVFIKKKFS
jgi:hypothetical protein